MIQYYYVMNLAFSMITPNSEITFTKEEVLEAMKKRLEYLESHQDEILEAVGVEDKIVWSK